MVAVHRSNEISLFGQRYPIVGPVEEALVSQFAQKQVTGDYTKDSELIASSWIISDQRGGIGVKDMEELKDAERCWFSNAWLNTKGHRTLPILVTATTNPTGADAAVLIEFDNVMYCAFGTAVYTWTEGSSSWTSASRTLLANPVDTIVHKKKLYFLCTSDFERYDGTTWKKGTDLGTAQKGILGVDWDDKLFVLDADGQLSYTTDEGVTWVESAKSELPTNSFTSLFTFDDAAARPVIYMGTKEGPFVLDYDNAKWVETNLRLPFHTFNCKGAEAFRDAAYFPSGMSIYEYRTTPPSVANIGLDKDGGLPSDYTGSVIKILRGHNYLYALVDATATATRDLYPAGEFGDITIYDEEGYSAIFRWTPPTEESKGGWSVAHLGEVAATALTTGVIATADNIYRLWFAVDGSVSFMPLQETLQNPKEVAQFPFALTSTHDSSWFDADNAVIDKLAIELAAYYEDMASDNQEYAMLYYGTDYDDDTWTLLTNDTFTDGKIDGNGETIFTFAYDAGIAVKAIRFREELYRRTADNTKSPDCRWLRFKYIKLLSAKFGFTVQVDCSRNYRFQRSNAMLSSLKGAVAEKALGDFTFKNGGASESHKVRIFDMQGVEIGGKQSDGLFKLNLIAP
jgi:hypothetical protein